jgi:hypothetical protein
MLCCFLNTINGILTLLGLSTIGLSWGLATNSYFFIILMIINGLTICYFIFAAVKDSKKRKIVALMLIGFILTNINYIYRIYNNKNFCKPCINKHKNCCNLDCGHKKHNRKNHHNYENIFTLLSLLGIILNLLMFFFYHKNFHRKRNNHLCDSDCNH